VLPASIGGWIMIVMKRDTSSQPSAAFDPPMLATSVDGDVLTVKPGDFPTVILRDSVRGGVDSLWTIRSAAAQSLFRYVQQVGFEFSLKGYFHPADRIWVPVLTFRLNGCNQTLAYTLGLVGENEFPEFFEKNPEIDLLVADTAIAVRNGSPRWPVPAAVAEAMRLGADKFKSDPEQKGLIRILNGRLP
jgi:hypothetical protein